MTSAARTPRKPAAVRRAEILAAATVEFADNGLAGGRLEAIAARTEVSHPRVIQMFGSKQSLFIEVVDTAFDRIAAAFDKALSRPDSARAPLLTLGDAYRRLLQRDRTVSLIMLHSYAAAGDDTVRAAVSRRYLDLQATVRDLTGADEHQVRTLFATGLVITVSTALQLPGRATDIAWSAGLLELVAPTAGDQADPTGRAPSDERAAHHPMPSGS